MLRANAVDGRWVGVVEFAGVNWSDGVYKLLYILINRTDKTIVS